ncbi:MAG: hypothetical protein PHS82_16670 [Lachnospiraceae bacterium]|nr:hypothetical protein [Lachnospiraceae bacterium]
MSYYKIDDRGAKWLRHAIKTPYALKLVCELYEGENIDKIGRTDITVSNLLKAKLDVLDQEFKKIAGFEDNIYDQIVKSVLLKINELFEQQEEVTRTQIKNNLRQLGICNYLGEKGINDILDFLEKHSFLQSYQKCAKSFFEESETIYLSGTQPVYDYIKALRMFEKSKYSDELELDNQVLDNTGALQMYSVMILDCYGELLWNNKSCQESLYEGELFEIVAFALINVNTTISDKYAGWLKDIMSQNAYALSLAVNKIIFPLARNKESALGSMLLDECLRTYDKPAERDVIWSIPSGLRGNRDSVWVRYEDIDYFNEVYELENTDCFYGMPLIWAWGLTSVDNRQRTKVRQEITKWGITCPEEFFKLFEHFSDINDIQVKTDFFAIAMSITYVCRKNHHFLKLISRWIMTNVFLYKEIRGIYNAAIRYYSRAIIECAFSEKIISDKQISKCRPPYRKNTCFLPFAPEATNGNRMGGYRMMDYDLSRYVLCDPIDRMFLGNRFHKDKIESIIEKYRKKYSLLELTSEKWILGIAFGYIKDAGWNDLIFYGKPNGEQAGEILGLDVAINRRFGAATHGSMSQIMTITEKYTWCAKMELLGFLADRVPYFSYEEHDKYVEDYGQLEDYVNPYQELRQIDVDKVMEETEWLLPEELTPSISGCSNNALDIKKWLDESPTPNFDKWINIQEGELTLFGSHCVSNDIQGVTTMMWISSGLIKARSIGSLIKKTKNREFAVGMINAGEVLAYPTADCYISPLEVCWFDWKEEHESGIIYGNNLLLKNVTRCTCDMQESGENEYEIPSKKVRELMGIISGDGYHYYNNKGLEIAKYRDAGERYGDNQHMLLVNKDIFYQRTFEIGLQPVWIIRVLKEISNKARERLDCFMDRDETYLVWKNSTGWKKQKIDWQD